jgi:hypothetical protein
MTDEARQPTEEELRAAYEAEIKQIRIEQILLENIVTLVNMGMRKTGLIPGTEDERDPAQVRVAIEGVRAHLPLVDQIAPEQSAPIQDALSQLQMAFVQIGGGPGPQASPAGPPPSQPNSQSAATPAPGQEPAPKSRLWIPGQ